MYVQSRDLAKFVGKKAFSNIRAPNGWWLNWLKSAVVAASALPGGGLGPPVGSRGRAFGGGPTVLVICIGVRKIVNGSGKVKV